MGLFSNNNSKSNESDKKASGSNWSRPPRFNRDGSITTFRKNGSEGQITTRKGNKS